MQQYILIISWFFSHFDSGNANQELNDKMKKMFTDMRKSLKEKIGNVNKDFI